MSSPSPSSSSSSTGLGEKNEGLDPTWAYEPPQGAVLLDGAVDAGEFDWDAVNDNKDLELWLIRVPDAIKPKHLENTKIELTSRNAKSARIGTLKRKHTTFDIWLAGNDDGDDDDQPIGGEEIKGLSCLLPRKTEQGTLYPAPRPIARHLVISSQPAKPTPDPTLKTASGGGVKKYYTNPPRESYPAEFLTHKFMPYGSVSGAGGAEKVVSIMFGDTQTTIATEPAPVETKEPTSSPKATVKRPKGKKRKGDGEVVPTSKKIKKAKTAA